MNCIINYILCYLNYKLNERLKMIEVDKDGRIIVVNITSKL